MPLLLRIRTGSSTGRACPPPAFVGAGPGLSRFVRIVVVGRYLPGASGGVVHSDGRPLWARISLTLVTQSGQTGFLTTCATCVVRRLRATWGLVAGGWRARVVSRCLVFLRRQP
jgi:hypothetical protein